MIGLELSASNPKHWRKMEYGVNSLEWRNLRQKVMDRDEYKCTFCGFQARTRQICHHMNGNSNDNGLKNLVVVCQMCNLIAHCGFGAIRNAICIIESGMDQTEIVQKTREFYLEHKKIPVPFKIDPNVRYRRRYNAVSFANDLVNSKELMNEVRISYRGFFTTGAVPFIEKQLHSDLVRVSL